MTCTLGQTGTLLVGTRDAIEAVGLLEIEVQRQFELRRLEWNRAEQLQYQVNELLKEIEQLKRGAQA